MSEFFTALARHEFLQLAVIVGLLSSVACGVIGTYVVTRRISYIAGAVAHSVLGGMGAAQYMSVVWGWSRVKPLHGAIAAAMISALLIGWVSLRAKQREDTVIGAIWAIGMAIGVLFIQKTPGYTQDLMAMMFGSIIMPRASDVWLLVWLDALILGLGLLFYNKFMAVCFDEEFARLRGVPVETYYLLLLCLTALTVVVLSQVVGIVLVIALLTLPTAVAGHVSRKLWHMMVISVLLTAALNFTGLAASYAPDWPTGATTILLAGALYLIVLSGNRIKRLVRPSLV